MTYTLIADGSSDKVLLPILTWSLRTHGAEDVFAQWADFGRIPRRLGGVDRISTVLDLWPCDILFVHRDAEAQPFESRRKEIANALHSSSVPHIPVVPIRMTEAWLLADELAIRAAAGNPNGTEHLGLPDLRRLEEVADPKQVLHQTLLVASGLNARRRARLRVEQQVHLIPNYTDDYSRLNALHAFRILQRDIRAMMERLR